MLSAAALGLILTQAQARYLTMAYNIGGEHGYPYTVAALIWQESSFCANRHHPDRSHGCGGVRLQTAEYTLGRQVHLAELDDPETGMDIAAQFYALCRSRSDTWRRSIAEYHYGIPKGSRMSQKEIDSDRYVLSVASKVKQLQSMRQDNQ